MSQFFPILGLSESKFLATPVTTVMVGDGVWDKLRLQFRLE